MRLNINSYVLSRKHLVLCCIFSMVLSLSPQFFFPNIYNDTLIISVRFVLNFFLGLIIFFYKGKITIKIHIILWLIFLCSLILIPFYVFLKEAGEGRESFFVVSMNYFCLSLIVAPIFYLLSSVVLSLLIVLSYYIFKIHILCDHINLFMFNLFIGFLIIFPFIKFKVNNVNILKEKYEKAISSIAHEIRTPLGAITLLCDGIIKKNYSVNEIKKKIKEIKDINNKSIRIIDFISTLFKKSFLLQKNIICVNDLLKTVIDYEFKFEKEKGLIFFKSHVKGEVLGDKDILFHVFNNVIKNALFFIKKHKKGCLYIDIKTDDKQLHVLFRDTAVGINPKKLPFIFDEFYSTREDGMGMGLFFVKNSLEMMEGQVYCRSVEGQFTEFEISLERIK